MFEYVRLSSLTPSLDVFQTPLLKSGGDVPRSGTGVVCDIATERSSRRFVSTTSFSRHETLGWGFRSPWSHHPGTVCASACPSSVEEGTQNVQLSQTFQPDSGVSTLLPFSKGDAALLRQGAEGKPPLDLPLIRFARGRKDCSSQVRLESLTYEAKPPHPPHNFDSYFQSLD